MLRGTGASTAKRQLYVDNQGHIDAKSSAARIGQYLVSACTSTSVPNDSEALWVWKSVSERIRCEQLCCCYSSMS